MYEFRNYLKTGEHPYDELIEKELFRFREEVLNKLDNNYSKVITNFRKYKHLLFFSAKYLELTELEKKHFSIEMLFNIYETDFSNKINKYIRDNLSIYEYCYSLLY